MSSFVDDAWLRQEVIDTAVEMSRSRLSPGKSGNVSARLDDRMFITPSGMPYEDLLPEDIVMLDLEGNILQGELLPSSEWHFHAAIYRGRPDAGAIVHTHSAYATSLACHSRGIPAFHYMVAVAGGADIRCAPYATFGTEDLARHVVTALMDRRACLLAHHGQVALGETLAKALSLAEEVEELAGQYWRALLIGEPPVLDQAEMARVLEKFKTYGKQVKG